MLKAPLLTTLSGLLLIGACSHAPQHTTYSPDTQRRAEILETVDAFFLALGSADADAFKALHTASAVNVIVTPESPDEIRYRPIGRTLEQMRGGDFPEIREHYWNPVVLERGGLAVVWAPYSIDVAGERIHCGIDVFNMSKHQSAWKIDTVGFTMEPSACDEIKPGEDSFVRPDYSALDAKEE